VSESQGISQHTARAQLKSIFAKTGVSRQAELVRLVLKSAASLA
jgi:DNA-binding CsgD family transcriptional regulator